MPWRELSVMEQRYQAVLAVVQDGWKVTEVADLRGDRLLIVHGELDIATAPELSRLLDRMRKHVPLQHRALLRLHVHHHGDCLPRGAARVGIHRVEIPSDADISPRLLFAREHHT